MRNLVAIPLLGLVVVLQSAIVPSFALLSGYADVVLVLVAAWALQEGVQTSAFGLGIKAVHASERDRRSVAVTKQGPG